MNAHQPASNRSSRRPVRWPWIVLLVVFLLIAWGIGSRMMESRRLRHATKDDARITVLTMKAKAGPAEEEIILPGTVQAWHDAPIYARTSGYLKGWRTDIGSRVKAGELLAEIDAPEVDAQLRQAKADLATAVANGKLAQVTAKRWVDLLKTDSVSRQEADEKVSDAQAKTALVASSKANVDRLTEIGGFQKVVAPFDGVITSRNTDTGALINAGSSGNGPELFHIADVSLLRVYVQVPQNYVGFIRPGMTADLHFAEFPGRAFPALFSRTSKALDPATRTLLVEFVIDNAAGELFAGGFTEAHLKLPSRTSPVRLPVNALLFRRHGLEAATIEGKDRIKLVPILSGRDFGKEIEVLSGVAEGETIVVNPPDSLFDGQAVQVTTDSQVAQSNAQGAPKADDKKNNKSGQKIWHNPDDKSGGKGSGPLDAGKKPKGLPEDSGRP